MSPAKLEVRPEMTERVEAMRRQGVRTALCTNNIAEFRPIWSAKLDLPALFDHVVDSSAVGLVGPPARRQTVTLTLDDRSFAYWDPAEPGWPAQREHIRESIRTANLADRPTQPGWRIDAGSYEVRIGTSSRSIHSSRTITVAEGLLL